MKKIIRTLLITSIATIGGAFANDCTIVDGIGIESTANAYGKTYINVLPAEAFKQALINMKAYCCTKPDLLTCTQSEKDNASKFYPKSEIFFDHLLDIAMRRLDGDKKLAYGLDPDPTALERRTKITEIANSANGTPANTIEGIYTGYRTIHTYPIDTVINNYNKNVATISLGDKYNTICELVKKIYEETVTSDRTIIWSSFINGCKNLVRERVKRETGYVKILMVQKSNQLLDETTKAYTKKYFIQEKMMALWNIIAKVKDAFQTIVQQAAAAKTCSK